MKSRARSLADNTIIIGIGRGVTQLISLILLPLYTHFLAADEYGLVDLIGTYIILLSPIVILQLDMGVFRFLVDSRGDGPRVSAIVKAVLRFGALSVAIVATGAIAIHSVVDIPLFWYALLSCCVSSAYLLLSQTVRGVGDNKLFAKSGILIGITTLVMVLLLIVWLGMGAEAVLLSGAAGNAVAVAYIAYKSRIVSILKTDSSSENVSIRDLLRYSIPLAVNGSAWWVVNAFNRTLVTVFIDTAVNGVYAVAARFPVFINSVFGIVNTSWTESAALHIDSPDRDRFFSDTFNVSLKLFVSAAILLISAMPIVFYFFINEQFHDALNYIPIIAAGSVFSSLIAMYSAIYIAKKLTTRIMVTSLVSAIISVILGLILIPTFGIYGAAVSGSVSFLFMATFRHFDTKKYVKISYDTPTVALVLLAIAASCIVYYGAVSIYVSCVYFVLVTGFVLVVNKKLVKYMINRMAGAMLKKG